MTDETEIKRRIKRMKKLYPTIDEKQIEKELIPLQPEEHLQPRVGALKKKKKIT